MMWEPTSKVVAVSHRAACPGVFWHFYRCSLTACFSDLAGGPGGAAATVHTMTPFAAPPVAPLDGTTTERYEQSRAALIAEQEKPDKDFARIDALINLLEALQLDIKHEHGLQGNNPNE